MNMDVLFINPGNHQEPIKRLGLPDRYFFENGGREYLLDRYGLAILDVVSAIDAFSSA